VRLQWQVKVLVAWVALGATLSSSQGHAEGKYWKGELEIIEFGYGQTTVKTGDGVRTFASANPTRYSYRIWQDEAGVVRHEMTTMSRNPIAEVGREIQLINYPDAYVIAFDKNRSRALRYGLETFGDRVPGQRRKILGHECSAYRKEWTEHGNRHVQETWLADSITFRDPLLKTHYILGTDEELVYMELQVLTKLESEEGLDESLFTVPNGLDITQIHH